MLSLAPCLQPGCLEDSVSKGRCEAHQRPAYAKNARASRLPSRWDSLRKRILIRDKWICYVCGGEGADAVDHKIAGDDHSPENLAAIHDAIPPFCHRKKTLEEALAARQLKEQDAEVIARAKRKGLL